MHIKNQLTSERRSVKSCFPQSLSADQPVGDQPRPEEDQPVGDRDQL